MVLDMDGVLLEHGEAMAGASEALSLLHERKVPFAILTNNLAPS